MNSMLRASVTADAVNTQSGDPCTVLVDGSDTAVTANGLANYVPTPGDRLLVQKVGGQLEIVQFISRGTVPWSGPTDLSGIQAEIDNNTQVITDTGTLVSTVQDSLTQYQTTNDAVVSGLQGAYDILYTLGDEGVQEDYIWVGDDPALSTVKSVQISPFVQSILDSPDSASLGTQSGMFTKVDIGDITYAGSAVPPMSIFYGWFTSSGLSAMPYYL